ncbi:MAG: hypothetical protein NVSMB22_12310 [Chloroflexota bacterium]
MKGPPHGSFLDSPNRLESLLLSVPPVEGANYARSLDGQAAFLGLSASSVGGSAPVGVSMTFHKSPSVA